MTNNYVLLCGQKVRINEDGLICLTDMWKARGRKKSISNFVDDKRTLELEKAFCKARQQPYLFSKQEIWTQFLIACAFVEQFGLREEVQFRFDYDAVRGVQL